MTEIRVAVRNETDPGGLFLTPVWIGAHNADFDLFDVGSEASAGLERIAEDGNFAVLNDELTDADEDGVAGVILAPEGFAGAPIFDPGETAGTTLEVDGAAQQYLSFASMVIPSNDAFIGSADALKLFDDEGRFKGEQNIEIGGDDVYDAGTEENTEMDAAFINQTAPDTGVDENGVVSAHPGYIGSKGNPGSGGIILGGVNAAGQPINAEQADFTQDDFDVATLHVNVVSRTDGTDGRDVVSGSRADDIVDAGAGNDILIGARGWDVLYGGDGVDVLFGNRGDDILAGGEGDDLIIGGRGDDTIIFNAGDGDDVLIGFGNGEIRKKGEDVIVVNGVTGVDSFEALSETASQSGSMISFDFGSEGSLTLLNRSISDLSADEFIFG